MSFFDSVGEWVGDTFGGIYHAATGTMNAQEQREQANLVNEQMKAYRDQTEITRAEINRVQGEQKVEKRRIEEKQIRSLRNNYRSSGLMSYAQNQPGAVDTKLGQ